MTAMQEKHALYIYLALTGRYDIPGKTHTIRGRGIYGEPVNDIIPVLDFAALERDAEIILEKWKVY
jgi:hypothetical protein